MLWHLIKVVHTSDESYQVRDEDFVSNFSPQVQWRTKKFVILRTVRKKGADRKKSIFWKGKRFQTPPNSSDRKVLGVIWKKTFPQKKRSQKRPSFFSHLQWDYQESFKTSGQAITASAGQKIRNRVNNWELGVFRTVLKS